MLQVGECGTVFVVSGDAVFGGTLYFRLYLDFLKDQFDCFRYKKNVLGKYFKVLKSQ